MKSGLGLTAARIVVVGVCVMTLLLPEVIRADAAQDAIAGTWLADGGDSKVEISRSGAAGSLLRPFATRRFLAAHPLTSLDN